MRYDSESGRINLTVKEFVNIARRGISPALSYDEDEPQVKEATERQLARIVGEGEAVKIPCSFENGEYNFEFIAHADRADAREVTVARQVSSPRAEPNREEAAQVRGEAFIIAYARMKSLDLSDILLRIIYINPISSTHTIKEEVVSAKKLSGFFAKCLKVIEVYAKPEAERVRDRLPTMKNMKFPYSSVREGQSEFIRTAYRTLCRGGKLYASAPTGTGKTVSALYPAMRALGNCKCDKIFYLTPKATTSEAVRQCLEVMKENGVRVRAIILTAKDKCCLGGRVCRDSRKLCKYSQGGRLEVAVLKLYDRELTVADAEDVKQVAAECGICPYELSLAYAELCDIVVCDFNHLFDPVAYIRRFFADGGKYSILVDEAHNLVERSREIYSAELCADELEEPAQSDILGEFSAVKRLSAEACRNFEDILFPYVKEELREGKDGEVVGAANLSEIPERLYMLFESLVRTVDEELKINYSAKDDEASARIKLLRSYYYKIKSYADTLAEFDDCYKMFLFYENGRLRSQLYCLDPSPMIRKRLNKCHGALLFSATLSPISYYRSVLGGERSDEMLEVASPFDPSQLSVTIMDKVSTRYSEREDTLGAVCRVIAAAVSAKRGHYMIFSPSFAYSEALAKQFAAKYPKIKILSQTKDMSKHDRKSFLDSFRSEANGYLIAFCVMGGIYSEGIDLSGDSLIGAVIVGIGIPSLSYEREALTEYFEEKYEMGKQYAYIYPGMNRVFQAAGRVIRREDDKGVIVLIDDRFDDPIYKKSLPGLWQDVKFIADPKRLREVLDEFWKEG